MIKKDMFRFVLFKPKLWSILFLTSQFCFIDCVLGGVNWNPREIRYVHIMCVNHVYLNNCDLNILFNSPALLSEPIDATNCQLEAAGAKPVQVPGFLPKCDGRGLYQAQQCYMGMCWCVNPENGHQIPGSQTNGPARCMAAVVPGESKE